MPESSAVVPPVSSALGKRKHPDDYIARMEELEHKRLERMRRNRASAQASRERRRNHAEGLAKRVDELTADNSEMKQTVELMRKENEELRQKLAQFGAAAQEPVKVEEQELANGDASPRLCARVFCMSACVRDRGARSLYRCVYYLGALPCMQKKTKTGRRGFSSELNFNFQFPQDLSENRKTPIILPCTLHQQL